jgi:PleD family two-component response regulator
MHHWSSLVQEQGNTESTFPPEKSYQLAKIEHYLERAEEYIRMARYDSARKIVAKVFSIAPDHEAAQSMLRTIERHLKALANGVNGQEGAPHDKEDRGDVVLLVDQDERVLMKLNYALGRRGYRVIGAGGYNEAVALLGHVRPNVIISEVNFENGPAGFDLYLHVSSDAGMAGIPFLFLATTIDRDILIAGKRLGVDDFILKPVDEEVVVASIQHCLTRKSIELRKG